MAFKIIDMESWERREFYERFINEVICTYSITVNLDITPLKDQRLYPAICGLVCPCQLRVHNNNNTCDMHTAWMDTDTSL